MVSMVAGCAARRAEIPPVRPDRAKSTATAGSVVAARLRADAEVDAAYYRERAMALGSEARDEIARTNFGRFRRGALYAIGHVDSQGIQSLERDIGTALEKDDFPALLDITAKILASDQADIRTHLFRAVALRELQRPAEEGFHRDLAASMLKSILQTGDGRGVDSAWTVYRVKEEYDVIKVLGFVVQSQALIEHASRRYDVLQIGGTDGKTTRRIHFDITELVAEEQRSLSLR